MARSYDVLVIGELNVDLILTGVEALPDFGQVEQLVGEALFTLGSSSAIFACGAARLGLNVGFIGKLGNDEFGKFLLGILQARGVSTEHILVDDSLKTGVTVHLTRGIERIMFTYPGSIAALRAPDIDRTLLHQARLVHLSSYFLQRGLRAGIQEILAEARKAGAMTSLDPGYDPAAEWNQGLVSTLNEVDIFLPNAPEASAISRVPCVSEALNWFARRVPTVAVKEGARGAHAQAGSLQVRQAAYRVDAVDSVGAGDSFDAGFLYAQLQGMDLATSLTWGCACGALAATRLGGIEGQPDVSQVRSFLTTSHFLEFL